MLAAWGLRLAPPSSPSLALEAWGLMLGARRFAARLELVAWGPDQDARLSLPSKLRR